MTINLLLLSYTIISMFSRFSERFHPLYRKLNYAYARQFASLFYHLYTQASLFVTLHGMPLRDQLTARTPGIIWHCPFLTTFGHRNQRKLSESLCKSQTFELENHKCNTRIQTRSHIATTTSQIELNMNSRCTHSPAQKYFIIKFCGLSSTVSLLVFDNMKSD